VVENLADQVWIGDIGDDPQLPSLRDSVGAHCGAAGAAADSLSFLRRRALAGVGTIAPRMGELGAKMPW
jgi:hypothetical protein